MTQGETLDEAKEMAVDCLQCYLESLQERVRVTVKKDEASPDAHTEEGSERRGFVLQRITGSHHCYKDPSRPEI